METLAKLKQEDERGSILFLDGPDDRSGFQRVKNALENLRTFHELKKARIGLVGAPSEWLVASSPTPEWITHHLGPQIISIHMGELKTLSETIEEKSLGSLVDSLTGSATRIIEPEKNEIEAAVRVYMALKQLIQKHRLDAVTLRCFDLVLHPGTTGCFALAQLNDENIVAGCEGDLVSTVGMLWSQILLGQIPWLANPAQIDLENNGIKLAHCTVPRTMIDGYELRSHFESGLGVGIQGSIPAGPVTLFRIGGKKMDKLWVGEGEIKPCALEENLCRTQVQVILTSQSVESLLTDPLGNHLLLARDHQADPLCAWWDLIGGKTIA
jgi:L-fucose isomerase-like protein